ncbi:MAG TPA: hypothetical protein VEY94_09180 [Patescibacteria group bacterium]|nr:hypothetical protein [Patescibacteria group bacterium]
MNRRIRTILSALVVTIAMATGASAQMPPMMGASTSYVQTNLVTSMKSLKAKVHDKNLLNPWGLVQGPTPFWISDNNAGVSTLYDGKGKVIDAAKKTQFVVTIPPPGMSMSLAAPSGLVFNGVPADFTGDLFIFSTEDGTISGWQPADAPMPYATSIIPRFPAWQTARSTRASRSRLSAAIS